jgi:hypothetical protein
MNPIFVDQPLILKLILSFEARTLWLASSSSWRELLSSRKFVHVAVCQNGISLRFCVDADRDNGDLVLSAISKNGLAFQMPPKNIDLAAFLQQWRLDKIAMPSCSQHGIFRSVLR